MPVLPIFRISIIMVLYAVKSVILCPRRLKDSMSTDIKSFTIPGCMSAGKGKYWLYWFPSQYVAAIKMQIIGVTALV